MTPKRLVDKFALITGGAGGIGRAVAARFAQEGATVAINALAPGPQADEALKAVATAGAAAGFPERRHMLVYADVASSAAVDAMFGEVLAAFGRLDILINNAGIQIEEPSEAFTDDTMDRVIGVNLLGAAYCARAAIAHFLNRPGGGAIVNNSSVHQIIPKPGYLSYSISKGGLDNMTRTLALEFADKGIRVNSVGPGAVATDINAAWKDDPVRRKIIEGMIPMRYVATPEQMAPVFAFLASDDASYVTGQTLYACGGLTLFNEIKSNSTS
ncbi:SDR family oxidoreductase [Azospirillum endophyticum]